jgi:hypothetical protein
MHLLMSAIVLGFGPAGELDGDAQAQPPNTQAAQVAAAEAGKRQAVVDPDDLRQTVAAEDRAQGRPGALVIELFDAADGEDEA